jgi:hypothetical protein
VIVVMAVVVATGLLPAAVGSARVRPSSEADAAEFASDPAVSAVGGDVADVESQVPSGAGRTAPSAEGASSIADGRSLVA